MIALRQLATATALASAIAGIARPAGAEASPAAGAAPERAVVRLALVVGVNRSVAKGVPDLHFADDDAARYFDLFTALGVETRVLSRMDANTQRLHPAARERAKAPQRQELDAAVAELAGRAAEARKAGAEVVLYFAYAGHGRVVDGVGNVALEDAELSGRAIETRVLDRIRATQSHVIVDACNSFYLAYARGPGGVRRRARGFSALGRLGKRPDVGVLLSTSSARDSHEWERVQAGVFSHEVRSGLYGAADADGDGRVSYREIAAFVDRANARIPNDRFRPEVHARPPRASETLLDIRRGLERRVEVDRHAPAHYVLEDPQGVLVLEFHNAPGEPVHFVRPASAERFYLRRLPDEKEFVIEEPSGVVETSRLSIREPRERTRGAAHEAFSRTFELPFGAAAVQAFRFPAPGSDASGSLAAGAGLDAGASAPGDIGGSAPNVRRSVGLGLLGFSGAGIAVGSTALYLANREERGARASDSQAATAGRNGRIRTANWTAGIAFASAGAAALSGVTLLLWPSSPVEVRVAGNGAASVELDGAF